MRKFYETMESQRSLECQGSSKSSLTSILHNLCGSKRSVASPQQQNPASGPPPAMLDDGKTRMLATPHPTSPMRTAWMTTTS